MGMFDSFGDIASVAFPTSIGSTLSAIDPTQGLSGITFDALGLGQNNQANVDADRAALSADYESMKALGDTEITNYQSDLAKAENATLTEGQTAQLEQDAKTQKAQAASKLASMGLSDSTMAQSLMNQIDTAKTISADEMLRENQKQWLSEANTHYSNAMSAYGLSSTDLTNLATIDSAQAAADQAAMANLASTAATVATLAYLSDIRTKENLVLIGETPTGLPVYSFNYKSDSTKRIGVMAQDVEKKFPEAVGITEDGYKTVNYLMLRSLEV